MQLSYDYDAVTVAVNHENYCNFVSYRPIPFCPTSLSYDFKISIHHSNIQMRLSVFHVTAVMDKTSDLR